MDLDAAISELSLIDHHVHQALAEPLARTGFEQLITEGDRPAAPGTTQFDSQVGFAIRRWCAPLLDLEPFAAPAEYLERRAQLGAREVARRLLRGAGIGRFFIDTGFEAPGSLSLAEMGEVSGARIDEVVRLEAVAEQLATSGCGASEFAARFRDALWDRSAGAVGLKSIVAYRFGLDFDPEPPSAVEVTAAAGRWLSEADRTGQVRLTDQVLLRHLLWTGAQRGLPLQLHTGFGDRDLDLHRADPLLTAGFLERVEPLGAPVMLLHCYPFHRHAGALAQIFPHVYFDVGLALHYTGARADAIVAEALELAPFAKILFSSDAYGPPELHYLGAQRWRRATTRVLGGWVDAGDWSQDDAIRVASMIAGQNAASAYRLTGPASPASGVYA
jgi:predicted TIM-barrel fold metal-dependent hydrolase